MSQQTPLKTAEVFIDGTLSRPQLDHPEGIALGPDGRIYCGGEQGQVYRVEADGSSFEHIAHFDGFALGMAFLGDDLLVCDLRARVVHRVNVSNGEVSLFTNGGERPFVTPNMLAVSSDGTVYVTDSGAQGQPGPGIYRFDEQGRGGLWFGGPLNFANGISVSPEGDCLYVAESFAPGITRIAIEADGSAGAVEQVVELPGMVPDGVIVGPDGLLYVGCYEPSRVLRIDAENGSWQVLAEDPTAHLLAHPTNVVARGNDLFTSNLGRWHLTIIRDAFV